MGLLDTLAERLDVFISDLRLWCTLPAFGIMLEMDNHLYPISGWNRLIKEVELDGERNRT